MTLVGIKLASLTQGKISLPCKMVHLLVGLLPFPKKGIAQYEQIPKSDQNIEYKMPENPWFRTTQSSLFLNVDGKSHTWNHPTIHKSLKYFGWRAHSPGFSCSQLGKYTCQCSTLEMEGQNMKISAADKVWSTSSSTYCSSLMGGLCHSCDMVWTALWRQADQRWSTSPLKYENVDQ